MVIIINDFNKGKERELKKEKKKEKKITNGRNLSL
jgi:hypothetical protein